MRNSIRLLMPLALTSAVMLSACGSVSGLTKESAAAPMRIADYDRVEVVDFSASDQQVFDDADKQAKHAEGLAEAQKAFADKIAEEITASGAFAEVRRGAGDGTVLRVTGDISRYDEGNIVARGLTGFAGQTHFDAVVTISAQPGGQSLATLTIDRNSWPLPVGASVSTLQTTNFFMNGAAKKVAEELAAKKKGAASQ